MQPDEKTIVDLIEEVSEEVCDKLCRYSMEIKDMELSQEEYERFLEEHCEKCPLDKLR